MIVDNFDIIRGLLKFDDKDDFYFLQIIQRKKDGNQIPSANNGYRTIKTYYIRSIEDFDRRKPAIIQLCEQNNARAYINLNVRNAKEVAKTLSKETDLTRIIGNIAHEIVFDEVKKYIPEFKELLVENVKQIMEEKNYQWYIFRGKDVWDKEEGTGMTIIKETLNANKEVIKKRIEDAINNFDIEELISDYLGKKMEEVADEFGKISDFLCAISSK